jgi:Na+/phosphate symporter
LLSRKEAIEVYSWMDGSLKADMFAVSVGTTSGSLVAASETRYALIIGSSNAGRITIAPGTGVVLDSGLNIPTGVLPFVMTYEIYGELVRKPWCVIGAAAGTIGVCEVLLG